jgi:uncharacterized protein HemY
VSFTFLSCRGTFAQLIEMHNQQAYIGIASRRCEQSLNGLVAWFMSYLAVLVRIAFVHVYSSSRLRTFKRAS